MAGKIKSLRGVEIYRTETGENVIFIRYQANGKPYRERIGPSSLNEYRKDQTLVEARKLLKERRDEIRLARFAGKPWLPQKERARLEEEAAAARALAAVEAATNAEAKRKPLLFEEVSRRFLEECGSNYARQNDMRTALVRMGLVFNGRYMDEITKADVRRYKVDRLNGQGPFAGRGKVGLRPPQQEIVILSSLFGFLDESEGRELVNPCLMARGRKYGKTKITTYRVKRKAVNPTDEQLEALFKAAGPTPEFQAFLKLTYFTAARPESEALALRHGDIELPELDKVQSIGGSEPVMGWVRFCNTKTSVDRSLPLHPDAAEALRAVMQQRPETEAEIAAWSQRPIFGRSRAQGTPWTRQTYRKAWRATLAPVKARWPELAGLWVRDLRKAANTRMRAAGTDTATAARILGHSSEMNFRYVVATGAAEQDAIRSLGLAFTTDRTGSRASGVSGVSEAEVKPGKNGGIPLSLTAVANLSSR